MTSEQINLLKESYIKKATRPDGRTSTLAEYMKFCLDGGIDVVTSKDCVIFDDANSMIHAICINEDMRSQPDFPVKIISSDISVVQQLEAVLSRENFETLLNSGFLSGMISEEKKKFLIEYVNHIKSSALATDHAPYFDTDPNIIPRSTSVAKKEELPKYVMKVNGINYTNIKDAISAVTDENNEITLLNNTAIDETITIDKPVVLDLGGKTITSNGAKGFEVKADVTFKNGKITNTTINGRCVDTRVGGITVKLDGMTLESAGDKNCQPLTIGGHDTTYTNVIISNSTIKANDSGYGIIVFVPSVMSIVNTDITGYSALYMKEGSAGSSINVHNSNLTGVNVHSGESNNFGAIVFEDSEVSVFLNSSSCVKSIATGAATQSVIALNGKADNYVHIDSTSGLITDGANSVLLTGFTDETTVYVDNTDVAFALTYEGYAIKDRKVTFKGSLLVGNTVYSSTDEALASLKDGDSIVLFEDATISSPLEIDGSKDIYIDLGGHTMTVNSDIATAFHVTDGCLTVTNGTINATGEVFRMGNKNQENDPNVTLTIGEGVKIVSENDCCIVAYNGTINTAGELISNGSYAVIQGTGNGGALNGNVTINIEGGSITNTKDVAIYHPQSGVLNIYDGVITGTTALYVKAGNVNIYGGTLHGTGEAKEFVYNGNGCNPTGDALVIEACNYGDISMNIAGGEFVSDNKDAVGYYQQSEDYNLTNEKFITRGSFSSNPSKFCEDNLEVTEVEESGVFVVS